MSRAKSLARLVLWRFKGFGRLGFRGEGCLRGLGFRCLRVEGFLHACVC